MYFAGMNTNQIMLALALSFTLGACGGSAAPAPGAKSDGSKVDAPKADTPVAPAKVEPPAKPAVEMVEHDLSSADPEWAGWVAQGPKGAKIMPDGVQGARIAAGRDSDFDLAFAPKKTEFADLKKGLQTGADSSGGKMKLTFTTDTAEALEWTSEGYGRTTYNFIQNMTADGRAVTCKNNYMVGIESTESLAAHKAACATLKKKA